jgi:hypothetical protein
MRRVARIAGKAWIAAAFIAVLAVGAWELFHGFRGTIIPVWGGFGELYVFALAGLPGYILWKWGSAA